MIIKLVNINLENTGRGGTDYAEGGALDVLAVSDNCGLVCIPLLVVSVFSFSPVASEFAPRF